MHSAIEKRKIEREFAVRQKALIDEANAVEEERKQAIYRPSAQRGQTIWNSVTDHNVLIRSQEICNTIFQSVPASQIIIAGSWSASVVAEIISDCTDEVDPIDLKPDDIDVYHGPDGGVFRMTRGGNDYIDGVV